MRGEGTVDCRAVTVRGIINGVRPIVVEVNLTRIQVKQII